MRIVHTILLLIAAFGCSSPPSETHDSASRLYTVVVRLAHDEHGQVQSVEVDRVVRFPDMSEVDLEIPEALLQEQMKKYQETSAVVPGTPDKFAYFVFDPTEPDIAIDTDAELESWRRRHQREY